MKKTRKVKKIKIFAAAVLLTASAFALTGCVNNQAFDNSYTFNKAIINDDNGDNQIINDDNGDNQIINDDNGNNQELVTNTDRGLKAVMTNSNGTVTIIKIDAMGSYYTGIIQINNSDGLELHSTESATPVFDDSEWDYSVEEFFKEIYGEENVFEYSSEKGLTRKLEK